MAWDASKYLQEARDAHGRWTKGAGALAKLVEGLVKDKRLTATQGKMIAQAMSRHTEHGRGLPADAEHDQVKQLEYLARTLRHDSLHYRQQSPPDIQQSKQLSRIGRQVEIAHAEVAGIERKSMKGINPYHLTPDSKPLDGADGHAVHKETLATPKPKLVQKAEPPKLVHPATPPVLKAPATPPPAHPQGTVDPREVKAGERIQTKTGPRTVKSARVWANGDHTLRWADGEGSKSTTYKPGVKVRYADGSTPAPTAPTGAPAPKVTRPATPPKTKITAAAPKVKFAVKVKQKVQQVKITASGLKPGDIVTMPQGRIQTGTKIKKSKWYSYGHEVASYQRIKHERRVEAVSIGESGKVHVFLGPPLDERLREPGAQMLASKGYGWGSSASYTTLPPGSTDQNMSSNEVVSVKRIGDVKQVSGAKVKLSEHPEAQQYAAALAQALENDDDLESLDPSLRKMSPGHSVGHTQQLLFDMAMGQRSGRVGRREVVTNDEYRGRLDSTGELHALTQEANAATPYTRFNSVQGGFQEAGTQPTLPGDATDIQLAKLFHAVSSHGYGSVAAQARVDWAQQYKAVTGHEPSIHDYAESLTYDQVKHHLQPSSGYDTSAVDRYLKATREKELGEKLDKAIGEKIRAMREAEGTADREYNIPQWNEVKMEPHTWNSIGAEIAKQADPHKLTLSSGSIATRDFVPSFYSAGLVDDGILYHRQINQPIDPEKIRKGAAVTIEQAMKDAGYAGVGETNENYAHAIASSMSGAEPTMDGMQAYVDSMPEMTEMQSTVKMALGAFLSRVGKRTSAHGAVVTDGHVATGSANNAMRKAMEEAGAVSATDTTRGVSTGNWTQLKPGQMLVLSDSAQDLSPEEKMEQFTASKGTLPAFKSYTEHGAESQELRQSWDAASSLEQAQAVLDGYKEFVTKITAEGSGVNITAKTKRQLNTFAKDKQAVIDNAKNGKRFDPSGKRIEYVPWQQDNSATVTPRSDRGRLTLHGYTPEEAAAKLHELGVIGSLESKIPANSIFRSGRRSGNVVPLHPDYVRGEALPPTTDRLLQHGLTAWKGSKGSQTLESIARTGGLQSIAERHRRGIHASGASMVGDAASGIDHVVFTSYGGGGSVGSGAGIKLLMRPDVLLRRDVLVSNTDFGGGKNRYNMYKKYRDNLEAKAGLEVGKTDLWTPLSPLARQRQLDNVAKQPGSAENNVAGSIHMNDVAAIQASTPEERAEIEHMLQNLKAEGIIDHVPVVVERAEFNDMAIGKRSLGTTTTQPEAIAA